MKSRHDEIRKKYGKGGWNVHIRWVWSGADAALGAATASLSAPHAGQLGVPVWTGTSKPTSVLEGEARACFSLSRLPGTAHPRAGDVTRLSVALACPHVWGHEVCVVATPPPPRHLGCMLLPHLTLRAELPLGSWPQLSVLLRPSVWFRLERVRGAGGDSFFPDREH